MKPSEFWSVGDYGVVGDLWSSPGRDLAASLDLAGLDVVDLATGTGVTAIAAATAGAGSVVGVDITPSLLAEAARRAEAAGADVTWVEADVMDVPLASGCADVVTSTFGLIFADDPVRAITEARRLARPGGRIVFTSWAPHGLFSDVRRLMGRHLPGAPPAWHETVAGIRGVVGPEAVLEEREFALVVDSAEAFVRLMERYSAPMVIAKQALGERWGDVRRELVATADGALDSHGEVRRAHVPYLVTTIFS